MKLLVLALLCACEAQTIERGPPGSPGEPRPPVPPADPQPARLTLGELEIDGKLDAGTVQNIFESHRPQLLECYERTLVSSPGIEGTVIAVFSIEDGRVVDPKAAGVHPDVEACVIPTVQRFVFPRGGKIEVRYSLKFEPS